nr:immunoglobulin heavy chain junction region [Macaca mulatta]
CVRYSLPATSYGYRFDVW